MAKARKHYDVKGVGGSGGRFRVGTIVQNRYGAPGVVLRILPPYPKNDALGPRAWVAYDKSAKHRRYQSSRSPEGYAQEMGAAKGRCTVVYERLYMLTPIGQAKRLPKCVLTRSPTFGQPAEGYWARASRPPRRKTARERQAETQARIDEHKRKMRSSKDFPIYKTTGDISRARNIEDYGRYAHWQRVDAQRLREAIAKHKPKGELLRQWRAELRASERRAARAERIVRKLEGGALVETARKAQRHG